MKSEYYSEHRTAEEATQEFADKRQALYARANEDVVFGVEYGFYWAIIIGLLYLGLGPSLGI